MLKEEYMDQYRSSENDEESLDIYLYLGIIRRRIWYLVTTFIVIVLFTTIYTFRQTPVYRSTSTIVIDPDLPQVLDFNEVSSLHSSKEFYETQFKIIQSRKVFEITAAILTNSNNPYLKNSENPLEIVSQSISVEGVKDTRLVQINADHPDPEVATEISNSLARAYIQHNIEDRRSSSHDAFIWLSEQLAIQKASVKKSEMELLKYKKEEDIVSLEKRQSLIEDRISETNGNYSEAVNRSLELETILQEIKKLEQQPELIESLPNILENSFVQQLKQEHSTLELELAKISKKYKPKHPDIISIQLQIDNIKERLREEVAKISRSIEIEWRINKAKEKGIKRNLESFKQQSMTLAQQAIHYGVLIREAESNRKMYDVLLHRLKETDISGNLTLNNIRVIDEAIIPQIPVSPNIKLNLTLAILIGLGLGVGLCLLVDYLDNTIKTEDDIKLYLKESLLGIVPKSNGKPESEVEISERAYHELKTVIKLYKKEHILDSLLITSAVREEGKTTSIINLGKDFASSGDKVLIIDADMFKPKLSSQFKIKDNIGLCEFFYNNKQPNDIIKKTDVQNLYIIPAGPIPPNPSEIIGSEKLQQLLKTVKKDFDIVLVDSPPVTATLDIAVLGSYVDGIALVIKANNTTFPVLRRVYNDLKSFNGNVIGIILNMVKLTDRYQDYYYSYSSKSNHNG